MAHSGGKGGWVRWLRVLSRIYRSTEVSGWKKAFFIGLAAAYLLSPIDLVPEALVLPLGLLDDALLVPLILSGIRWITPDHLKRDEAEPDRKHVDSQRVDSQ